MHLGNWDLIEHFVFNRQSEIKDFLMPHRVRDHLRNSLIRNSPLSELPGSRKDLNSICYPFLLMAFSLNRILIPFLVIALVIIIPPIPQSAGEAGGEEPALPAWTVFVYMAGDNNLEDAAIDDFNEMETVGSTDGVNIIVQLDRASGHDKTNGDWEDTRRYRIEKDSDLDTINSTLLDDNLGELDMSRPDTLRTDVQRHNIVAH